MADSRESPKLKRKREGGDQSRKKSKTQRVVEEGLKHEDQDIQMADVATAVSKMNADKMVANGLVNGLRQESTTPSSSNKSKGKKAKNSNEDKTATPTPSATAKGSQNTPNGTASKNVHESTPSKESQNKKRGKKRDTNQDQEGLAVASQDAGPEGPLDNYTKTEQNNIHHLPGDVAEAIEKFVKDVPKKFNASNTQDQAMQKRGEAESGQKAATSKGETETAENTNHSSVPTQQLAGKAKEKKRRSKPANNWSISAPIGGWFLPQDPVFSADEEFLILASARALQIYSTKTSLPASTLSMGMSYVSTYALSATSPHRIYTANASGLISLWDSVEGKKIARWDIGTDIRQIVVVPQPGSKQDLVYCHELRSKSHIINAHALRAKGDASQTELKQILKTKSPISGIQVLFEGKIVVVATHKSVLVGKRAKLHKTALQDFEYTWREVQTSKRVTTFDAYVRDPEDSKKGKSAASDPRDHLDLVVGGTDGVIFVFEDILSSLARVEQSQKAGAKTDADMDALRPKRLHWHRETVGSVKWSRDGNYIISGGTETVLVIWQLSTGKQQHLPHLTAAIENIVVSPNGASYAVTLANNSVIVLSTTELEAKTNIVGMQSRRVDLEQYPRETSSSDYSFEIFDRVPMVVNPRNAGQVMLSTPSSQPRHQAAGARPEPYMQTFDLDTQRSIAGQALTRNNATDLNTGPEGRPILEPSVKLLQISNDGKWLATVDEWIPAQADTGYLDEGNPELNEEERVLRREVYLKFWKWDEENCRWVLDSRIDAPHFSEAVSATTRVLDLVADPVDPGFATVGEDGSVRIWRPKTRMRDGTIVRGAEGEGLVTWSVHRSIELSENLAIVEPGPTGQASLVPRSARLGFSPDGSVLATAVSCALEADPGVVYIIDAIAGTIRRSITELQVAALSCLGILGRHLIVIGDSINIWDLVVDELVYSIPFNCPGVDLYNRAPLIRLAINEKNGTFAVSWPQFETNDSSKSRSTRYFKKASTKVSVFDPYHPQALWSSTLPDIILSLASAKDSSGYIALDANSSFRRLTPKAGGLQLPTPPPETALQLPMAKREQGTDKEDEDLNKSEQVEAFMSGDDVLEISENDKPVVRPEQLQQVFDIGPSHALPPVKDLFNAVVGLYARKPRTVPST